MLNLRLELRTREIFRLLFIFSVFSFILLSVSVLVVNNILNRGMSRYLEGFINPQMETYKQILTLNAGKPEYVKNMNDMLKDYLKLPGVNCVQVRGAHGSVLLKVSKNGKSMRFFENIAQVKFPVIQNRKAIGGITVFYDYIYAFKSYFSASKLLILVMLNLISLVFAILIYIDSKLLQPLRLAAGNIDKLLELDSRKRQNDTSIKKIKRFHGKTTEIVEMISEMQEILNMLFDISRVFTSNIDINEVLDSVLEIIRSRFDSISAAILEMSEDGFLRVRNHRGFSREFVRTSKIRIGEGILGKVYENSKAVIINDVVKQGDPYTQEMSEQEHIKSALYVPLVSDNHPMGVLIICSKTRTYFDFKKVKTLTMIAESTSIAMKNSKLYEQLQNFNRRLEAEVSSTTQELTQTNTRLIKKVRELKALYDIAFATSKKLDLDEVISIIIERIQEIMNVEFISFVLYNEKTNELEVKKMMIRGVYNDSGNDKIRMIDAGIYTHVYKSGEIYISNKMFKEDQNNLGTPSDYTLRSILVVPLKTKYKTTALFVFGNKIDSPFNDDDIRLTTVLSNQTVEVIENIKLYQENRQRVQDLTTMQELSISVSSSVDIAEVLTKTSAMTIREIEADAVIFMLYQEGTKELIVQEGSYFGENTCKAGYPISLSKRKSVCVNAFKMGEPIWMGDYNIDEEQSEEFEKGMKSVMVVPLKVENRPIGILYVGSKKEKYFEFDHLRLASLIGDQVALIIEKAKLYGKLDKTVKELKQTDEIKNKFILSVSNELKTPLQALDGFFNVISSGEAGRLKPEQKKFFDLAGESIKRLHSLIEDLVDISRIENGRITLNKIPCCLPDLVAKTVEGFSRIAAEKNRKINIESCENVKKIEADSEWLAQAISHLISNAIKFSPNEQDVIVRIESHNGDVKVVVKDNGIGIPENDLDKIFNKFHKVEDPAHKALRGSGLGLSIVKSIVDLHNGRIEVTSTPNTGTQFTLIFPAI